MFFDHFISRDRGLTTERASRIEGIGRPRVEASFVPGVIDAMVKVPDRMSLGAMVWLSERLGRVVGPSTGSNLVAVLACASQMQALGESGSIVSLLCDGGERYAATCFNADWRARQGLDCAAEVAAVGAWCDAAQMPLAAWQGAGFD